MTNTSSFAGVPHGRIVDVRIVGAPFYPRVEYALRDGLDAFIGEKGSGKSTNFEMIRYCLGCEEHWSDEAEDRMARNLGGGTILVTFETAGGKRYGVSRKWATDPKNREPPTVLNEDGSPANVPISMFRVLAIGQTEIERYAKDPAAQLSIVDFAIASEVAAAEDRIGSLQLEIEKTAGEILRLEGEVKLLRERAMEAQSIEAELEGLMEGAGPDATRVEAAHKSRGLRERELHAMRNLESVVEQAQADVARVVTSTRRAFAVAIDDEVLRGSNGDLFSPIAGALRRALDALEEVATRYGKEVENVGKVMTHQRAELGARHAKQEGEYGSVLAQHKEHASRAAARVKNQQRYAEIATAKATLVTREAELRTTTQVWNDRVQEVSDRCNALSVTRIKAGEELTARLADPNIRVRVEKAGQKAAFEALLAKALKSEFQKAADLAKKLADNFMPEEIVDMVVRNDASAIQKLKQAPDRAALILKALGSDRATFLRVQAVRVDDRANIEIKHGKVWKNIRDEASPGQRASALVPLFLLVSNVPLLIDQPEDHLSEQFFSGLGAEMIVAKKHERQTLFGTYSSNIILLGKADWVVKLACLDGEHGTVDAGTRPQMREPILDITEGGRAAFDARRAFYEGRGDQDKA